MDLDKKKLRDLLPLVGAHAALAALDVLGDDIRYHYVLAEKSQRERRAYVRALFALIEAWIFMMKQICLHFHERRSYEYELAELAFLREEQYRVEKDGPAPKDWFIALEKNFKFTCELRGKVVDAAFKLDVGSPGWFAFTKARDVRDRLTHPRSASDLNVSDKDLADTFEAQGWVTGVMVQMSGIEPPDKAPTV